MNLSATAVFESFGTNICGRDVTLPYDEREFSLLAAETRDRASGEFRVEVSGVGGVVRLSISALPSETQPCIDARVEIDADVFACSTNVYQGTLCTPISCVEKPVDTDGDSVSDDVDNCPSVRNAAQDDLDGDGLGDACDEDRDGDGCNNAKDDQPDESEMYVGTAFACGKSIPLHNSAGADYDHDGLPSCADDDDDGDGIADAEDDCPIDQVKLGSKACHPTYSEFICNPIPPIPYPEQRCQGNGCVEVTNDRLRVTRPIERGQFEIPGQLEVPRPRQPLR